MSPDVRKLLPIDPHQGLWEQAFTVAPLVVVGSREADGRWDLAPKHLAMPASWTNHFVFVCTPAHGTYINIRRDPSFTVTYVRPDQVIQASLAAAPRCCDGRKVELGLLPTIAAPDGDGGLFLQSGYLFLRCRCLQFIDGLASNSLIIAEVTAAWVAADARRDPDGDDAELLQRVPAVAYLYPGRFGEIHRTQAFPFAKGSKR